MKNLILSEAFCGVKSLKEAANVMAVEMQAPATPELTRKPSQKRE
jgi:hypothetical protein